MEVFELLEQDYTTQVIEGNDINKSLQKIAPNLNQQTFAEALLAMLNFTQDTTHYDKNAFGSTSQALATKCLRDRIVPEGWELKEWKGGAYLTVSPCKTKAILVAMGNKDVGNPEGIPKIMAKKGTAYEHLIYPQLALPETCQLWVWLIYRATDEVKHELSCPKDFTNGLVLSYQERIIFDKISLNSEPLSQTTVQPTEYVEPDVKRRKKSAKSTQEAESTETRKTKSA